ncbi:hypothetical protein QBC38DRAFT_474455 [Podospora fimiseda]|uniref:Secreted protein n=1 Tax=Podospora fimiseda TaxID=252190 RepID=A0AAN7H0S6_9PEZI|nr:hypothetical protein QBC38DRAFT_474455 [Podospora fimiseda]
MWGGNFSFFCSFFSVRATWTVGVTQNTPHAHTHIHSIPFFFLPNGLFDLFFSCGVGHGGRGFFYGIRMSVTNEEKKNTQILLHTAKPPFPPPLS